MRRRLIARALLLLLRAHGLPQVSVAPRRQVQNAIRGKSTENTANRYRVDGGPARRLAQRFLRARTGGASSSAGRVARSVYSWMARLAAVFQQRLV
jgi:hypothetical protein